jgi:hypothetical protein
MPEQSEVVLAAVSELVKASGGDAVVALQALLEQTQRDLVVAEKSTVAGRKAKYRKMWEDFESDTNVEDLVGTAEKFNGLIDRIAKNHLAMPDGIMTAPQAQGFMEEHLESRDVTEVLDARKELRKAAVFAHIDAVLEAQGVADPGNANGELEVPECGMKFSREGAGLGDPELDEGKLRVALGEAVWAQISDKEIIPARVELLLNKTRLLDLANRDPQILEKLRDCLIPGKPKSPRLNVRKL